VNDLSICLAYYEAPGALAEHLRQLAAVPEELRQSLELVVCDDASPRHPALPVFDPPPVIAHKLLRVVEDIPWNVEAARNIAAENARAPWLLILDMDTVATPAVIREAMTAKLDARSVYDFGRVLTNGKPYKAHPYVFLLHRDVFDRIGGFDERLCGTYGGDSVFRTAIRRQASSMRHFPVPLLYLQNREGGDAEVALPRKGPDNAAQLAAIYAAIATEASYRPLRGTSQYARIL
jgi:hypothetical protein